MAPKIAAKKISEGKGLPLLPEPDSEAKRIAITVGNTSHEKAVVAYFLTPYLEHLLT
jgi:hypothetical protein